MQSKSENVIHILQTNQSQQQQQQQRAARLASLSSSINAIDEDESMTTTIKKSPMVNIRKRMNVTNGVSRSKSYMSNSPNANNKSRSQSRSRSRSRSRSKSKENKSTSVVDAMKKKTASFLSTTVNRSNSTKNPTATTNGHHHNHHHHHRNFNILRSFSHSAADNADPVDLTELDDLRIRYQNFINRHELADEAAVDDEDDEPNEATDNDDDENESLLHYKVKKSKHAQAHHHHHLPHTNELLNKINSFSKSYEERKLNEILDNKQSTTSTSSSSSSSSTTSQLKQHGEDEFKVVIMDPSVKHSQAGEELDEIEMQHLIDHTDNVTNNNNNIINREAVKSLDSIRNRQYKLNNDYIRLEPRESANDLDAKKKSAGESTVVVLAGGAVTGGVGGVTGDSSTDTSSSSPSLASSTELNKKYVKRKPFRLNHSHLVIVILFFVNLLNYIDRYTLAGVLLEVRSYFGINDGESGLLQTVFICSYMLLAPLFGYLGDRYSRKWIIIFGISFWSLMTFLGSFVPHDKFWLFMIIRSLVGIGEASYSCVAPTIIGDLFTNEARTKMLALFYLAVPVGSGLGYIVGDNIAKLFGNWQYALRITPVFGFICVVLLVLVVQEPKRGGAEGSTNDNSASNVIQDVVYLLKNKTFMWITFGFTFASFVLGGLSWWVPTYVQYAMLSNNKTPEQIPLKFGFITLLSGLVGVGLSSIMAEKLRKITDKADPFVCAFGSLVAVPSLFILVVVAGSVNEILFWFIAAIAISAMCLSWTIVADILLYTIYPNRRSIASALNILICHLFGDAGSPYVIGAISDAFRHGKADTFSNRFSSLQVALYAGPFFALFSFGAYLFAAIYVAEDKKDVDDYIKSNRTSANTTSAAVAESALPPAAAAAAIGDSTKASDANAHDECEIEKRLNNPNTNSYVNPFASEDSINRDELVNN